MPTYVDELNAPEGKGPTGLLSNAYDAGFEMLFDLNPPGIVARHLMAHKFSLLGEDDRIPIRPAMRDVETVACAFVGQGVGSPYMRACPRKAEVENMIWRNAICRSSTHGGWMP